MSTTWRIFSYNALGASGLVHNYMCAEWFCCLMSNACAAVHTCAQQPKYTVTEFAGMCAAPKYPASAPVHHHKHINSFATVQRGPLYGCSPSRASVAQALQSCSRRRSFVQDQTAAGCADMRGRRALVRVGQQMPIARSSAKNTGCNAWALGSQQHGASIARSCKTIGPGTEFVRLRCMHVCTLPRQCGR